MRTQPDILFISHGGGPMPLLGDPGHRDMVARLTEIAATLPKPSAILVISAHWEAAVPTITSAANPALAQQIHDVLQEAGISAQLDDQRGFDHGLFVPLKLMYPQADIPCVQLSLVNNLDATTHLAIGRALQALEHDNLLVIGSGFSFHNMRAFFTSNTPEIQARNQAFEDWLAQTCTDVGMEESARAERLAHWERAPYARFCHPREEHLLPLHVCYGLAGTPSDTHISATILGKKSGMFYWGTRLTREKPTRPAHVAPCLTGR